MKRKAIIIRILLGMAVMGSLVGCQQTKKETVEQNSAQKETEGTLTTEDATNVSFEGTNITVEGQGAKGENGILTISKAGVYQLSGSLEKGKIIVAADNTSKVQIVLNGVDITCSDDAPIFVKQAETVYLTLAEGTKNKLTDGTVYNDTAKEEGTDATIYSKDNLVINGTGSLSVKGNYKHAILSKDDLTIEEGNINIEAVGDGLQGKNIMKVLDGTLTIKVGDDGIHGDGDVVINKGTISITESEEGIEGNTITVNGGTIDVTSKDDGFNAAGGEESTNEKNTEQGKNPFEVDNDSFIKIVDGDIHVNASGDGLDSNGDIFMEGGKVMVSGPENNGNGAMDYGGNATITGGVAIIAGSAGMAQSFGDKSTQNSILYTCKEQQKAKTTVQLKDASGKVVLSYTPEKSYQTVVISSPDLKKGGAYTLYLGNTKIETITISEVSTMITNGVVSQGPGGMEGGRKGSMKEGMNGERPQRPDMPEGTGMPEPPEGEDTGL